MDGKTESDPIFHGVVIAMVVKTVGDVTKMAAVTHAVTGFPLVLNEIRSVTAFTPIFRGVVITVVVISVKKQLCGARHFVLAFVFWFANCQLPIAIFNQCLCGL